MIVDNSYFIGEILIAGLATTPIQNSVNLFIGKHEPVYLQKVLGYAFNKLFSEGLAADPVDARWTDLRDGAEYTDCNGFLNEWTGFKNDEKQSPIANYIYYWYERDNVTFTATVGEQEGKTDNAKSVSGGPKMTKAWNEAVNQTKVLHDYLLNAKDDTGMLIYPEFAIEQTKCFKRISYYGL